MSFPTIPDLPEATNLDDSDLLLVRQPGSSLGIDKRVLVGLLRQINIAGLPPIPNGEAAPADLMLIQRGSNRFQIRHDQISVPRGTKMWFYQNAESIPGWSIFSETDCLLAVKGGSDYVQGGTIGGSWQQHGVNGGNPGGGLTIDQMPSHTHQYRFAESSGGIGQKSYKPPVENERDNVRTGITLARGGTHPSNPSQSMPHNHGDIWRPRAAVGVILQKN